MIFKLIDLQYINIITFISLIAAFLTTCLIIKSCQGMLPRDQGRAFAINGKVSQGKPRGAGILLYLSFHCFPCFSFLIQTNFNLHNTCHSFDGERLP